MFWSKILFGVIILKFAKVNDIMMICGIPCIFAVNNSEEFQFYSAQSMKKFLANLLEIKYILISETGHSTRFLLWNRFFGMDSPYKHADMQDSNISTQPIMSISC